MNHAPLSPPSRVQLAPPGWRTLAFWDHTGECHECNAPIEPGVPFWWDPDSPTKYRRHVPGHCPRPELEVLDGGAEPDGQLELQLSPTLAVIDGDRQ